ncbi:hypothetical protein CYMTET_12895 [Cymbomonas tetramitiformis]|uniref:Flavodoxin-like domain-containing protein n=1 Tax=Cymbomonas tetramitiformis TaxID=36881 RepID=A0AAE0GJ61_9CHLO|nr:hypothetical protein CYMTET_12895 [Cymbomonas tetramitiformis]
MQSLGLLLLLAATSAGTTVFAAKEYEYSMLKSDKEDTENYRDCSSLPRVLITYYSDTNNTQRLGEWIMAGVREGVSENCGVASESTLKLLPIEHVDFQEHIADWADVVVLGSPTYYGNPAPEALARIEQNWNWSYDCSRKVGAVFATGGGIHSGTESVLLSLMRTLLAFRFMIVGSDASRGGTYSAYGATAITATSPFDNTRAIRAEFHEAAVMFGKRVFLLATRYVVPKCNMLDKVILRTTSPRYNDISSKQARKLAQFR